MINILYVSTVCSEKVLDYIFETSIKKPIQSIQKFHRLLVQGLGLQSGDTVFVETLSSVPVIPNNHKRKIWLLPSEKHKNVTYKYIPFINIKYLKNITIFINTFFKTLAYNLSKRNQGKIVICDILNTTITFAALLACKVTFTKTIAIVTDVPGLLMDKPHQKKDKWLSVISSSITSFMLHRFDGYILLTDQMNSVVNPNNRPYIIMEGLVDIEMSHSSPTLELKHPEKVLIYAGGLYQKYGIKMLIDAFKMLKDPNLRLHLYGTGEMAPNMDTFIGPDPRIKFFGMVPNNVVVTEQLKATLLINPRPTIEEFTKYSFPSKNMEYMVSGTPIITTKLPGMPTDYYPYIYMIENETVEGVYHALETALSKTNEELLNFGLASKKFVINFKNNKKQAERILNLIKEVNI